MKADLIQPASDGVSTSYDEVPYPSYPFAQTHPARLATIATLLGMRPAPVEHCRVLELGCASGGNLIPMADVLPGSSFVGLDASARQISEGVQTIELLGLRNIDLRIQNLLEVDDEWGQFDYIICHGVYSWVAEQVQEKILTICKRNLAPQGVAYVSYNTCPGWNMRGTIRDMMCFRGAKFDDPQQRVRQARAFLDFASRSVPTESNAYGMLLKREVEMMRRQSDAYLLHEYLEEENRPVYFFEFVQAAAEKQLQYLGDADYRSMCSGNLGSEIARTVRGLADNVIESEQYLDFLRNRTFRQSLLCHDTIAIDHRLRAAPVRSMYVAANLREIHPASPDSAELNRAKPWPEEDWKITSSTDDVIPPKRAAMTSNASVVFATPAGATVSTSEPFLVACLRQLTASPDSPIAVEDLLAAASSVSSSEETEIRDAGCVEAEVLRGCEELLHLSLSNVIDFMVWRWPNSGVVSERPVARALARYQASCGQPCTNYRHQSVQLKEVERRVLQLLDGCRDRLEIVAELARNVADGKLVIRHKGACVTDSGLLKSILQQEVERALDRLSELFLLNSNSLP